MIYKLMIRKERKGKELADVNFITGPKNKTCRREEDMNIRK